VISAFLSIAIAQVDPYRLPIGSPGSVRVAPGQAVVTQTGETADADQIAELADGKSFVFLGENHATKAHQDMQAEIIAALIRRGRNVMVGVEMLTRPKQAPLDAYISRSISEEQFLQLADWKGQWGFDWSFYRPVFATCREYGVPMVALNVPRDWVRTVGRGGFAALTPQQRLELPVEMSLENRAHRKVFEALIGGHPLAGTAGENMYAAQVLWDEAMADSALKATATQAPDLRNVFVVVAGSGHTMYGQGINYRIARRTGQRGLNVTMIQSEGSAEVSRGLGDVVFVSPKP